jgi:hypothetical protein
MTYSRTAVILALIALAGMSPACGGGSGNIVNSGPPSVVSGANDNKNAARTNVEELGMIVNVPYEAEDIVWKESPNNKRVVAVLRFSPQDSNKVVTEAEAFGRPENATVAPETWFPDELIAQSDMSGDSALKGLAYPANRFFQEPYANGKLIRIEGSDYFILDLTAK